jgi:hypothetical protein
MARPVIKGGFDLTPEFLNALAKKGKNEHGKYRVEFAMWHDEERPNDKAPHLKGPMTIEGEQGGVKSYGKCWLNLEDGGGSAPAAKPAADVGTDLF